MEVNCVLDSGTDLLGKRVAMAAFSAEEAHKRVAGLAGWKIENRELVRRFEFKDFVQALAFVNRVGQSAEAAGHHPDIDIRYNKVLLALTTHDAGGLTELDFELATKIDALV
jgi:4a-hydroxytetrahydrobiopterin dehydratase